ncbi:MAG TPA: hypothetical protein VFS76_17065 [Pyrinomonadaceae bacterium]|nr:hypothetical protein [Pyrinomonadaceae bacterium]
MHTLQPQVGDVRTGLTAVIIASVVMLLLHVLLLFWERGKAAE